MIIRYCAQSNPQVKNGHRVDLTANLKGLTIHCKEESPDMYASIDAAAQALNSKLRKYKERRMDGWHSGNSMGDDLLAALEAWEEEIQASSSSSSSSEIQIVDDFVDPEAPTVTKINSYDLDHPIPLQEAIFALDYVDHDFFVFKNEETSKVNIVYKRNAGGVGLIEI